MGKLGLTKVTLMVPTDLHRRVAELVEQEKAAGRTSTISRIYADALTSYLGVITSKERRQGWDTRKWT